MTDQIAVHVVTGRGAGADVVDYTWQQIGAQAEELGITANPATMSDTDLTRVVNRLLEADDLTPVFEAKVNRPSTGNIVIGAQNTYG